MRTKILIWINRYLPAEIICISGGLIIGLIANHLNSSATAVAFLVSWAETILYYLSIIVRDVYKNIKKHQSQGLLYSTRTFLIDIRNVLIEFGIGELLDTMFIRPAAIFLMTRLIGNVGLGILVGVVLADIFLYLPTIIMYEVRNKYLPSK